MATPAAAAAGPPRRGAHRGPPIALVGVTAQAPPDGAFRDRLSGFADYLAEEVRTVVYDGVETGAFRADADPETSATLLVTLLTGAHSRRVALGTDDGVREAIGRLVDDHLGEAP